MSEASIEMPKYKCHKEVHALHIAIVDSRMEDGERVTDLLPSNTDYAPIRVDSVFTEKHKPKDGGYLVVYDDGYRSFSPKEAFKKGYTLKK